MDTEKPLSGKKTNQLKIRRERLPVIEVKKVKNGKTYCKKSTNTSLKPNLSFPKLKLHEVLQPRADSGDPGSFRFDIVNQQANSPFASLFSEVDSLSEEQYNENNSKVIGISECQVRFKVPSADITDDEIEDKEENLEESNALKRWKYWLRDKRHMQNVLSKKLGRNSCDLQIQESDKYRAIVEDKLLFTYAQIPEADKWRGHPFFWKQTLKLGPQKVPEYCEIPTYFATKTKILQGKLPEMEFIGTPNIVQKEKNPTCTLENQTFKKWEKMPYRQEQLLYYKEQRKKIKPRDIIMDELAVVGVKIKKEEEESQNNVNAQNIPEIIITEENSEPPDFRRSIFCLAIDGEEINYELGTKTCQNPDKVFTWQVDFGTNKIGSLVERVLRIENRGTIAVAYDWIYKKNDPNVVLDSHQPKPREPWFFFDKNSGLFIPGQIYDLKFYHLSQCSGLRKEVWYLKTKPPLGQNQEMGKIVLSAVAAEEFSCKKYAVESFLKKRVADAIAKFALEIILYKTFNPAEGLREIEYRSLFKQKELFEYHNPKHYYHSSIVKDLNELYDEISQDQQAEWDFSLCSLITKVKCDTEDKKKKNFIFKKIADNAQKLFRPNYLYEKKFNKYKMVYEILCKMATLMEEDYNYFTNLFQKKENTSRSSFKAEESSEEEFGETSAESEMQPLNYMFFQTMLHLKVHARLGEAIESIVGVIETNKLFESWKKEVKLVKPSRRK